MVHVKGVFLKSSKILYCCEVSGAFSDILLVGKKIAMAFLWEVFQHVCFLCCLLGFWWWRGGGRVGLWGSFLCLSFRDVSMCLRHLFAHHTKCLSSLLPVVGSSHVLLHSRCYYLPVFLALRCLNLSKPG